jgi:CSLREA domain-containing protein
MPMRSQESAVFSRPTRALARAARHALPATATVALLAGGLAGAPPVALAAVATYTVNTTVDTPDADVGTLRAAIMQANFHAGPDVIVVPAGTFKLTRKGRDDAAVLGDLDLTDSVTLKGAGSAKTIIDANGASTGDRGFEVLPTASAVTISGLTIRNGKRTSSAFDEGGGLLVTGGGGSFALSDVVVEKSTANYSGGVAIHVPPSVGQSVDLNHVVVRADTAATGAAGGIGIGLDTGLASLRIRNSHVYGNTAYEGAGIYLQGTVPLSAVPIEITATQVDGNHATGLSGGIENHAGTATVPVTLVGNYVHGNTAGAYGGGIGNYGYLVVTGSTVSSNTAAVRGAGVYAYAGSTTSLVNTTVSANSTTNATTGSGGGIYEERFSAAVAAVIALNSTFGGNAAATGGAFYLDAGTTATLTNTLIAKGATGANCSTALGGTSNFSDDASCGFGGASDGAPLHLSSLALHGGRTPTQVPLAGSAAVDAGSTGAVPATDQRGITRPQGATIDVGAVEVCQAKPAMPALAKPANGISTTLRRLILDWSTVTCVQGYTAVVRRGSTTGRLIESVSGLQPSTLRTVILARGYTYYWRVTAVGDRGTTTSAWRHFTVK